MLLTLQLCPRVRANRAANKTAKALGLRPASEGEAGDRKPIRGTFASAAREPRERCLSLLCASPAEARPPLHRLGSHLIPPFSMKAQSDVGPTWKVVFSMR
jgi:hypothetical protein